MTQRAAGILLHPTSLPGPFPVGDLGSGVAIFLDWAAAAGQTLWQVLPLGPTGYGGSPYNGLCAMAGNPLLIAPEKLQHDGLLTAGQLEGAPPFFADQVDFARAAAWKEGLLRQAWQSFRGRGAKALAEELAAFEEDPTQQRWLDDWALFSALKQRQPGSWTGWDLPLRRREPSALAAARRALAPELAYHRFVQFLFFRQWRQVREAARLAGVAIMGDLPFYVALDSVDVWAHPELFELDDERRPLAVSGVPPDYFSATGQLWGNPIYDWGRMREEGFSWWVERMAANLRLADAVRIDHFRGFDAYWRVPAGEETAIRGEWVAAPGRELFATLRRELGDLPLVAEDLGVITPGVEELRDAFELPGLRVLQFAFGSPDNPHLPHRHTRRSLVYTGTHDNDTSRGWFEGLDDAERQRVVDYLGVRPESIAWDLIRGAYTSVADRAVVPLQDVLGLGSEARMNTPGRSEDNWSWRARRERFTPELALRLRQLAVLTGRAAAAVGAEGTGAG